MDQIRQGNTMASTRQGNGNRITRQDKTTKISRDTSSTTKRFNKKIRQQQKEKKTLYVDYHPMTTKTSQYWIREGKYDQGSYLKKEEKAFGLSKTGWWESLC